MGNGYRTELTELAGFSACALHDDDADLHATWLVGAGMLGASLVHRGEELLWQGAGPGTYARERKFMGIPFLYPWANRLSGFGYRAGGHDVELDPSSTLLHLDDNGLPIHGVLNASRDWSLRAHDPTATTPGCSPRWSSTVPTCSSRSRSATASRWRSTWRTAPSGCARR